MEAGQVPDLVERPRGLENRGDNHGDPVREVEIGCDEGGMFDLRIAKTGFPEGNKIVWRHLAGGKGELGGVSDNGSFPGRQGYRRADQQEAQRRIPGVWCQE